MLEVECRSARTEIFLNTRIYEIKHAAEFEVRTESAEFHAPALVVATGGLSIPQMGATQFGYEIARQFGLKIQQTRPALVPLIFGATERKHYCDLTGVSTEVVASANGQSFREKLLITHRGLSGPAILQISSYWGKGRPIRVDLAPGQDVLGVLGKAKIRDWPPRVRPSKASFPSALQHVGLNCTLPQPGTITRWRKWRVRFTNGRSCQPIRKATKRPK
jgi:predicted flavoprotein YhiN